MVARQVGPTEEYRAVMGSSTKSFSRRSVAAGSAPRPAVARSSDSNGNAFSFNGPDNGLRAEWTLLQTAASGHES